MKLEWKRLKGVDSEIAFAELCRGLSYVILKPFSHRLGGKLIIYSGFGMFNDRAYGLMSWRDCVTWVTYMPSDLDLKDEMTRINMLLAEDGDTPRKSEDDSLASMTLSAVHNEIVTPTTLRRPIAEQANALGMSNLVGIVPDAVLEPIVRQGQASYGLRKMCEESGEVSREIKLWMDYGKPLNKPALLEELGDVLFSIAFSAEVHGWTLADVAKSQIEKIRSKFGGRWTREKAQEQESLKSIKTTLSGRK
jgi:NTP pyrophosphatase (non-canonical NTP hydrolase)